MNTGIPIKKLEIITDTSRDENYSNMKEFLRYSRDVKKLAHKEMKKINKIVRQETLSKGTREWTKQIPEEILEN